MSSVLNEICERKKVHVEACKTTTPITEVKARIADQNYQPRGFIDAIKNTSNTAIIAEIKKASPSKGIICQDFDPQKIAKIYEENGATCLSVLTDTPYFQGRDEYLLQARKAVSLPALRKDFMVDEYQIYESRMLGADCILLIMAALSDDHARDFYALADDLGMDVLVEVHNAAELERALTFSPRMIGVNNRNLKTLNVDTQTSFDLLNHMPKNTVRIAESGLKDKHTLSALETAGYQGFLIGESLMRAPDTGVLLRDFVGI